VNTLEALLGSAEPHATFHDAKVVKMAYDPGNGTASLTAELCVGDPDTLSPEVRERRRTGVLELGGVAHWHVDRGDQASAVPGVWLADDGPLSEAQGHVAQELARQIQRDQTGWYLYFADSNSFIYWVATEATFRWLETGESAA
jgi:hypothetical protein